MNIYTKEIDTLDPETRAMIQCFYSRSTMSIKDRIAVLGETEEKIKDTLKSYYVGYGHASIAQCGNITIFFEGVSMLAAKAIQDHPLYNGQESSTRYIDFSKQDLIIPSDSNNKDFYIKWGEIFRQFYINTYPKLVEKIKSEYPGDDSAKYNKTVSARSFDILRGFLPAGFSTNVAWTGSIDSVNKHLRKLLGHPLQEIRELAKNTYDKLIIDYPHSFRELIESDFHANKYFYGFNKLEKNKISSTYSETCGDYSKNNPFYNFPQIQCELLLDFASWRDLQRHRNMSYIMPLLTTDVGMHDFYIHYLPDESKNEINTMLTEFCHELSLLEDTKFNKQYAIPMGFYCPIMMQFNVHQAVYLAELRSSKTVHPTLRTFAQELGKFLKYQYNIDCNIDYSEDNWTLKRGTQDITKVENV